MDVEKWVEEYSGLTKPHTKSVTEKFNICQGSSSKRMQGNENAQSDNASFILCRMSGNS